MTERKRCDKGECRRFDLERENERLLAALFGRSRPLANEMLGLGGVFPVLR